MLWCMYIVNMPYIHIWIDCRTQCVSVHPKKLWNSAKLKVFNKIRLLRCAIVKCSISIIKSFFFCWLTWSLSLCNRTREFDRTKESETDSKRGFHTSSILSRLCCFCFCLPRDNTEAQIHRKKTLLWDSYGTWTVYCFN